MKAGGHGGAFVDAGADRVRREAPRFLARRRREERDARSAPAPTLSLFLAVKGDPA
jgi:hypothetical protein